MKCPECDGKKEIEVTTIVCKRCNGQKRVPRFSLTERDEWDDCPKCYGRGYELAKKQCPNCNGIGEIPE